MKTKSSIVEVIEDSLTTTFKEKEVIDLYFNLVMFLTKGEYKRLQRLLDLYNEYQSWGSTFMTYRRELRAEGRGQVNSNDIIRAYQSNDIDTLRELLSEKCLEYLTNNDIEFVLERLEKKGWGIERVLERLERKPTSRLKTVVL